VLPSPYREYTVPLLDALHTIRAGAGERELLVFLSEAVTRHWYDAVLLNRGTIVLRERLIEEGFAVATVPYDVAAAARKP